MSGLRIGAHSLLGMLEIGSVELELWGDPNVSKLIGVGFEGEGYALVKVRDEAGREAVEIIPLNVIKEVRLSE